MFLFFSVLPMYLIPKILCIAARSQAVDNFVAQSIKYRLLWHRSPFLPGIGCPCMPSVRSCIFTACPAAQEREKTWQGAKKASRKWINRSREPEKCRSWQKNAAAGEKTRQGAISSNRATAYLFIYSCLR